MGLTYSLKAFSKCPGKCKINKLGPDMSIRIDRMLIEGWTYSDIADHIADLLPEVRLNPEAQLNLANLSTHVNKHLHPHFRNFMR